MLRQGIVRRKSDIEGMGLVAMEFIPKGTMVWQMSPEDKVVTYQEWLKESVEKQRLYYQYKDKYVLVSDGSEVLNHSCDPNLWWEGDEKLVARRDIRPGEEITYDYASSDIDERTMPTMKCYCGSVNCRKMITAKDCLDPEFQKANEGHLPTWVVRFIEENNSK